MKTIKLLSVMFALVALMSCSSADGGSVKEIVGNWYFTFSKNYVDNNEITLEENQILCLYNNEEEVERVSNDDSEENMFGAIPYKFNSDGTFEVFFFQGSYEVVDNRVICTINGEQEELTKEGEYLLMTDVIEITSYKVMDSDGWTEVASGTADMYKSVSYLEKR